eukprot:scaffold5578_cov157-Skeletonema_marinoi.AAC.12
MSHHSASINPLCASMTFTIALQDNSSYIHLQLQRTSRMIRDDAEDDSWISPPQRYRYEILSTTRLPKIALSF